LVFGIGILIGAGVVCWFSVPIGDYRGMVDQAESYWTRAQSAEASLAESDATIGQLNSDLAKARCRIAYLESLDDEDFDDFDEFDDDDEYDDDFDEDDYDEDYDDEEDE